MNLPPQFIVPPQRNPLRLDLFLAEHFPKTSRRFWQRHLACVILNGKKAKKGTFLKGGEVLSFEGSEIKTEVAALPDPTFRIKVVLKDPSFLVVDKPAGMPVHPLSPQEKGTLIQAILAHYPEIEGVGFSKREPGLLHRLDNRTSGLVLIARTPQAFQFFREEFEKQQIKKEYLALVIGRVLKKGKIDLPIAHHPKNKKKMIVVDHPSKTPKAQPALTLYTIEKTGKDTTLLRVQIPTGVRHQIRVHLAFLGHPIVGDELYGGEKVALPQFDRIALHAEGLAFRHPIRHNWVECRLELPSELLKICNYSAPPSSSFKTRGF